MKHKMTIEFANGEDLMWAVNQIDRARKYCAENGHGCGTPLSGGNAAILLSALGRSVNVTSRISPADAHRKIVGR